MSMDEEVPFRVTQREAFWVWLKIGLFSFGGPAGQIAMMHKELVERRKWLGDARFLHALNYCMLLPGPEAQQLAIYIGWLMHRTLGGVISGALFVLPGFLLMMLLSILYSSFHELTLVSYLFFGLKAAVFAIVFEALLRIAKRALKSSFMYLISALAFIGIFFFHVPFPVIIIASALLGLAVFAYQPALLPQASQGAKKDEAKTLIDQQEARGELSHTTPSVMKLMRTLSLCLLCWWLPIFALGLLWGMGSIWYTQGIFFSQTAVVTFGGAYAVLAYIAQEAVQRYSWLKPGEMLDGLGLAETTPGPLILVVQFVAFVGAYRHPGGLSPLASGVLGACVTIWATFLPCFLWIFLGAPYIEALRGNQRLSAALSCITAAVVGVIANLTLWFGLHVWFGSVQDTVFGFLHLSIPVWGSFDLFAVMLSLFAAALLFWAKVGVPKTLLLCSLLGLLGRFGAEALL
jgi:chromate transporter